MILGDKLHFPDEFIKEDIDQVSISQKQADKIQVLKKKNPTSFKDRRKYFLLEVIK